MVSRHSVEQHGEVDCLELAQRTGGHVFAVSGIYHPPNLANPKLDEYLRQFLVIVGHF